MADRALFIGWGQVVRGREERALEVFNETVGYYGRLQQEGRIERFDPCLLDPSGSGLDGFFMLHGTGAQLNALKEDPEFRRMTLDANMIVDDLRMIDAAVGEGVAREMGMYMEAVQKIAQHA